jgi:hypothetical protein
VGSQQPLQIPTNTPDLICGNQTSQIRPTEEKNARPQARRRGALCLPRADAGSIRCLPAGEIRAGAGTLRPRVPSRSPPPRLADGNGTAIPGLGCLGPIQGVCARKARPLTPPRALQVGRQLDRRRKGMPCGGPPPAPHVVEESPNGGRAGRACPAPVNRPMA